MKIITPELLDQLTAAARHSPRLRLNHNLHPADGSRCQRLLNAIEPLSYIRPHRHLDQEKDEGFILLRGRLGIILFADDGAVAQTVVLTPAGNQAVDIPHGIYHTGVSLEPGTIFYESKGGPYLPLAEAEKASWAPAEGDPTVPAYLERLRGLFAETA
jgi:cupin fold WbuC family metalloprotein